MECSEVQEDERGEAAGGQTSSTESPHETVRPCGVPQVLALNPGAPGAQPRGSTTYRIMNNSLHTVCGIRLSPEKRRMRVTYWFMRVKCILYTH